MTAILETTPDLREGVDRETIETVQAMAGKYNTAGKPRSRRNMPRRAFPKTSSA